MATATLARTAPVQNSVFSPVVDELTYRSYAHNRIVSPEVSPSRWAVLFPTQADLEARFRKDYLPTHPCLFDVLDQAEKVLNSCDYGDEASGDCWENAVVHHLQSEQEYCLRHFVKVEAGQ